METEMTQESIANLLFLQTTEIQTSAGPVLVDIANAVSMEAFVLDKFRNVDPIIPPLVFSKDVSGNFVSTEPPKMVEEKVLEAPGPVIVEGITPVYGNDNVVTEDFTTSVPVILPSSSSDVVFSDGKLGSGWVPASSDGVTLGLHTHEAPSDNVAVGIHTVPVDDRAGSYDPYIPREYEKKENVVAEEYSDNKINEKFQSFREKFLDREAKADTWENTIIEKQDKRIETLKHFADVLDNENVVLEGFVSEKLGQ